MTDEPALQLGLAGGKVRGCTSEAATGSCPSCSARVPGSGLGSEERGLCAGRGQLDHMGEAHPAPRDGVGLLEASGVTGHPPRGGVRCVRQAEHSVRGHGVNETGRGGDVTAQRLLTIPEFPSRTEQKQRGNQEERAG